LKRLLTTVAGGAAAAMIAAAAAVGAPAGIQAAAPAPILSGAGPGWPKRLAPSDFVRPVDNPWLPLRPGSVYRYRGVKEGVPMADIVRIAHGTKRILGVRTTVVHDTVLVHGRPEEETFDYYAQDRHGNVWYFGEDTKEYTNGVVSSTAGSWEAGVDGALPGIIMQASPGQGEAYRQEYRPTVAEDVALIKQLGASAEVPAGRYSEVLVTNDRDLLDLNKDEDKYFAPGVGLVKLDGLVNGHREDVWLVSILAPK
jgi:hypothetical protein